jgi:hypothetical protein
MYRILVIANETCPCPALLEVIAHRARAHSEREVRLVAPALNSRLRHYLSDSDAAVAGAREHLAAAVAFLADADVDALGTVGDADPYNALHDTLAQFEADEVMLSTHPPGRSHWLEHRLVERVRAELDIPVEHVVSAYGALAV